MDILHAIGNTSMVRLAKVVPPGCAAIQVGQKLGPQAIVVTLLCDSGLKYLSTDGYRNT